MPQSSPCAPAFGRHRDRRHAGQLDQPVRQLVRSAPARPAPSTDRLQRMDVGEARQPRHLLVQARIVLHRARAERIEPAVDRVVLAATGARSGASLSGSERPGRPIGALRSSPPSRSRIGSGIGKIDAGHVGAADLEDQRLFDDRRPRLPVRSSAVPRIGGIGRRAWDGPACSAAEHLLAARRRIGSDDPRPCSFRSRRRSAGRPGRLVRIEAATRGTPASTPRSASASTTRRRRRAAAAA